jgi:hypothetical protein
MADKHPGVNGPAVERANLIVEEHIELNWVPGNNF